MLVAAALVAGQALGFLRHATVAWLLGTGPEADALAVAFVPVDLLWSVLSTAMIFGAGPTLAKAGVRATAGTWIVAGWVAAGATFAGSPALVAWFAPGLTAAAADAAVALMRVFSIAVPAVVMNTLLAAVLYARSHLAAPAFYQAVLHLATIVCGLAGFAAFGPASFAAGYALGAWVQMAVLWRAARGGVETPVSLRKVVRPALPVILYSGLIALNPVISRAYASTWGPGVTAGFDYSLRLVGVPLALLVVPLSSALAGEVAERVLAGRWVKRAVLAAAAVVVALEAGGLMVVRLAFERGAFSGESSATVSAVLQGFAPVLVGWTAMDLLGRWLFLASRPRGAILAAGSAVAINAAICLVLPSLSLRTIGLGAVAGFSAGAAIAAAYFRRNS
jgi:putative peptidoglycan lipid II flippase